MDSCSPEVSRILREYDSVHSAKQCSRDSHHGQIPSIQRACLTDVKNVLDVMEDMVNQEDSADLFSLDT